MKLIEENPETYIDFTDCGEVKVGEMFIIEYMVFMKIRDRNNNVNYVDMNTGEEYQDYEIRQLFRGWKKAKKVEGELKWWRV